MNRSVGASSRPAAGHPESRSTVSAAAVGRPVRFAIMASVVGLWMGIGWALHLGAVAYLLTGIPFTVGFQVLIARRPITWLWVIDASSFHLDRVGIVIALGFAGLPMYAAALGLANGRPLDVAYGLVGVAGAVPAAFALRAMDARALTAMIRSILTAGVVAAALFVANRIASTGRPITDLPGALESFAISLLLYIPMVFVIEEVFFRGALDTHARGPLRANDIPSAMFVSLLWGAWHAPLVLAEHGLGMLPLTFAFHLIVGLLLTIPWRGSGNLAVPGITHALIDAIRDGLAAL